MATYDLFQMTTDENAISYVHCIGIVWCTFNLFGVGASIRCFHKISVAESHAFSYSFSFCFECFWCNYWEICPKKTLWPVTQLRSTNSPVKIYVIQDIDSKKLGSALSFNFLNSRSKVVKKTVLIKINECPIAMIY